LNVSPGTVGRRVCGASVIGDKVGANEGAIVVGLVELGLTVGEIVGVWLGSSEGLADGVLVNVGEVENVGTAVTGEAEGRDVGMLVCGLLLGLIVDGALDGINVGAKVPGEADGIDVCGLNEGLCVNVGALLKNSVGFAEGLIVGPSVIGANDGAKDGCTVGHTVGPVDGDSLGMKVGEADGAPETGEVVGDIVGEIDGDKLGDAVGLADGDSVGIKVIGL